MKFFRHLRYCMVIIVFSALIAVCTYAVFPMSAYAQNNQFNDFQDEEFLFFSEEDLVSVASLSTQPISKAPGFVSVISRKTIERMPARFLTDIFKSLPGMDVRYSNFGEYYVSMRGYDDPASILLMVNGVRMNDSFNGHAPYDLPVEGIERIEIIRGPGSALYGTNALVAVINVITKEETGLAAKVGYGTFNTAKAYLAYGADVSEGHLSGFINYYGTDGGDAIIQSDLLALNNGEYSLTPGKIKDNKNKVEGNLRYRYKDYDFDLFAYSEDRGPNAAYHDIYSPESEISSSLNSVKLSREVKITDQTSILPKIYASRWSWDKKIQLYPDGYTDKRDIDGDGNPELFPDGAWKYLSYDTNTFGGDLRISSIINDTHKITAGLSLEKIELQNTSVKTNYYGELDDAALPRTSFSNWNGYSFPSKSREISALYIQDSWQRSDKLIIVFGGRYDNYSDFGSTVNPRFAATIFPYKHIDIKVQYATAFKAPTLQELHDRTDIHFAGNPDLKPVKVDTVEAGIGYTARDKSYVRFNGFVNNITDDITTFANVTRLHETIYQNSGNYEIRGAEIDLKLNLNSAFTLSSNVTNFNVFDKVSNTWITRIPQLRANTIVTSKISNYGVFALAWYYSDTVKSNSRNDDEKRDANRTTSGPHNLVNLSFLSRNFSTGIFMKFSVFNVLDVDYHEMFSSVRYRFPNAYSVEQVLLPSNERTALLEIGINY